MTAVTEHDLQDDATAAPAAAEPAQEAEATHDAAERLQAAERAQDAAEPALEPEPAQEAAEPALEPEPAQDAAEPALEPEPAQEAAAPPQAAQTAQRPQQVETRAVFARERRSRLSEDLTVASPIEASVMSLEQAVAVLGRAYQELQRDDTPPDRLRDIQSVLKTMGVYLTELGASSVAVNAAAALRIFNERRLGFFLDSLDRSSGESGSTYSEVLRTWRLAYPTAHRWVSVGRIPADLFHSYLDPYLAYLTDGYAAGEDDATDVARPVPSTQQLLRAARSTRPDTASANSSADAAGSAPAAAPDLPLDWAPPDALLDAAGTVLAPLERVIGAEGLQDADWRGSLLVVAPTGATASFADHLLHCYGVGSVSRAILVVPTNQNSSWWASYAGWPVCLLSRIAVPDLPAAALAAFCVSDDEALHGRFREAFRPLGFGYPGAHFDYQAVGEHDDAAEQEYDG